MPAVGAHQLALHYLRLDEEVVQVLEHGLVALQLFRRGRLFWQGGKSQLEKGVSPSPPGRKREAVFSYAAEVDYLGRRDTQGRPVYAGEHVDQELLVELDVVAGEFGVFGMEGERVWRRPARFDGTRQEVEAEDLHRDCGSCSPSLLWPGDFTLERPAVG